MSKLPNPDDYTLIHTGDGYRLYLRKGRTLQQAADRMERYATKRHKKPRRIHAVVVS